MSPEWFDLSEASDVALSSAHVSMRHHLDVATQPPQGEAIDLWLDPAVLEWDVDGASHTVLPRAAAKRAYEILDHAEQRLSEASTDLDRVDVLGALRRAIEQRTRTLNDHLNLKAIPLSDKPSGVLETIGYLGIARELVLKELISVRNAVEHEDARVPEADVLQRWADSVWYFLRSTDALAHGLPHDIELVAPEGSGFLSIAVSATDWVPRLRGKVSIDLVTDSATGGWIMLRASRFEKRAGATAVSFAGEARGPAELLRALIQRLLRSGIE